MRETIRTILSEWQDRVLPKVIEREVSLDRYLNSEHVVVVKGFRRVGKTYLLYHQIKNLLETHNKKEVVYFNFEDERIPLKKEFLGALIPAIKEVSGDSLKYLFLDEVQIMPEWSRWLRRIIDTEQIKIFITGSSSKISEREIPTELRGRYLEVELFPLSFNEFLRFRNVSLQPASLPENQTEDGSLPGHRVIGQPGHRAFLNYFTQYLEYGGMPAVVLAEEGLKREIILNYYNTLIRRDIIEKYKIRNEMVLKDLIKLLLNATHYTGNKLFRTLKSLDHSIGKATILKYVSYLKDSFFMDELLEFSPKIKNQLQRERKIYFVDSAFINLLTSRTNFKEGRLLENMVFYHLKRKYKHADIFYCRAEKAEEVDFLLIDQAGEKKMIQVSYNLDRLSTREREIRALVKVGKNLGLEHGDILTFDTESREEASWFGHKIQVTMTPAWKFFMKE